MAMQIEPTTLSAFRNMVLPGVHALAGRAAAGGVPIRDADLWIDFVNDELQLCVKHRLISRMDMDMGKTHYVDALSSRLEAAMRLFHRMPAAKAICVDRRRLQARGEKARKQIARPIKKARKAA